MRNGHLYESHGAWFFRWYEGNKRVCKRLGSLEDYPTKKSVEPLAEALVRPSRPSLSGHFTLDEFIERMYLPHTKELRASTHHGYDNLWKVHIQGREEAALRIRDYRTTDVQRLLDAVASRKKLSVTTLQHVKAFLSGAFRYAAQSGVREGNPVRECRIPKSCKPAGNTYAYSLEEIRRTLEVLPLLPKAAIAVAAFAGLRLAEIHGLDWTDYNGEDLNIERSTWRGVTNPTKSKASKNYLPVIPPLREILDEYREASTPGGPMFPVSLEHVGNGIIRKCMEAINLSWEGWHSFRRGIASNLFELGCDDVTVQRVLRHSKVQVTREHYIKVRDPKLEAAMEKLSEAFRQHSGSTNVVTH